MSSSRKTCAVCGSPSTQQCGSCRSVSYCGRDHQRQHWHSEHRSNCTCYRDCEGRLVATRDIPHGAEILRETPVLLCPIPDSPCICLGCHKLLEPENEDLYKCTSCQWPMCVKSCETSSNHLKECPILRKIDYDKISDHKSNSEYNIVAALRYLQLDEEKKRAIQHLSCPVATANPIRFSEDLGYKEEELHEAHAFVSKYAIEILKSGIRISGIFPRVAKASHSCRPNTKRVFQEDTLVLVSTVGIKKGEDITVSYSQVLSGTLERREHLSKNMCIECTCDRCKDPTEFGTYAGSIYCSRCVDKSREENPKMMPTDSLDTKAPWKCEKCERSLPGKTMRLGNETVRREIDALDGESPKALETFLLKYSETLHPNNAHVLRVKHELTKMYGRVPGFTLSEMNDAALERQIDLCNELLEISDKLDPGWSRFRGCLLLDLQAALVVQAKRHYNDEEITKDDAQEIMNEAMVLLQEAVQILSPEPEMKELLEEKLKILSDELDFD